MDSLRFSVGWEGDYLVRNNPKLSILGSLKADFRFDPHQVTKSPAHHISIFFLFSFPFSSSIYNE